MDSAILLSNVVSNNLRVNVKNEITQICAKFGADLINTSKVTSRKTEWPRFFCATLYLVSIENVKKLSTNVSSLKDVFSMLNTTFKSTRMKTSRFGLETSGNGRQWNVIKPKLH